VSADLVVTRWGARGFGRRIPCAIGRGGVSHAKREGDGASPAAIWTVMGLLYRPDRMACPAPWAEPIGPGDLWSDDAGSADYNHMVRAPYAGSHERLARADRLYDAVLVTDWNWPEAIPGAGSAIFVHRWRKPRHPTAGCIAFSGPDLRWLLPRLVPGSRIEMRG